MALDDFSEEDSKQSNNSGGGNENKKNEEKKKDNSGPHRTVGVGRKKKVFNTEEMWDRTVDYIENSMGFDIDEVLSWRNDKRHKALHVAIINSQGDETEEFDITEKCFVCDHTFSFPHDWEFVKYKGKAVCEDHKIKQVREEYKRSNQNY